MKENLISINKKNAEKLHKNGGNVYILPSKIDPKNVYIMPAKIGKNADFSAVLTEYIYYNCNTETGRGVAFYTDESGARFLSAVALSRFGIKRLSALRRDIVLNSYYIRDYENIFNINPVFIYNFFECYVARLYEIADENGDGEKDFFDIVKKYDTIENLYNFKNDFFAAVIA